MHITINTITKKVIIHDLTLTKTELVVKMLEAIGEDADRWQVVDKEDEDGWVTVNQPGFPKITFVDKGDYDQVEKLFGINKDKPCVTTHEIPPLKNLQNPDDGAKMS